MIETLQFYAGVMFWTLVDFLLFSAWVVIIYSIVYLLAKGVKHD